MRMHLARTDLTPTSTEGDLSIDNAHECFTLELPCRDGLPGSAIPPGVYPIHLRPSPKFERSIDPWVKQYASQMPHIDDIPERSLIMIHWLNTVEETEGCVGVGLERGTNFIGESRAAFAPLHAKIKAAIDAGEEVLIEVVGGNVAPNPARVLHAEDI